MPSKRTMDIQNAMWRQHLKDKNAWERENPSAVKKHNLSDLLRDARIAIDSPTKHGLVQVPESVRSNPLFTTAVGTKLWP
jgi:hypothetical protein